MELRLLLPLLIICFSFSAAAAEVEVFTQQDWNQGAFSGTSADRNDDSGNLGLGYRNGSPTDSLVGYWRFDRSVSGSGGTVKDYSGNRNDGTARNGVSTGVQGVLSTNSFSFDGSDDYVSVSDSNSLDTSNSMTVSFWIKIDTFYSRWNALAGKEYWNSGTGWVIYEDNGALYFVEGGGSGISGNWEKNTNEWYMITATSTDGSGASLYVNANEIASGSVPLSTNNVPVNLGARHQNDGTGGNDYTNGKIDEFRIYDRSLTQKEVKNLYLKGKPYQGNFTGKISNSEETTWNELEVDTSSTPTDTDVDAVFKAKDSSDNVIDEQVIGLQGGKKNYSLDVADSEKAEVVFNGSSSDVTSSWEINGFKVYAGFCDYRGQKNECVMNSTRQLESKTYDVSSIFESRSKAVFEAFSGTSILNISNSSRLSGTWKGSFDVRSNPVTIEPGANFKPENGRIIIGE